ncbi:hypothetical protein [Fibrivirga algicola]|uniref:DUF4905 domain-containing protein n=1 Tax=Fibrivirga algicola TaxID=2950420 RepID=A0ABX0QCK1_9BACT|nr:hypothetical protein [Fibrivirga algicola]NID10119.1 hypothetical protein [Fibrivirga algicola]
MLGLFRRKKKEEAPVSQFPLPAHMADWLSVDDYNHILRLTVEQLSLKGSIELISDEGTIEVLFEGQKGATRFYMDNLLRKCIAAESTEWEAMVASHVKILPINSAAITYIYKDFEFAAPLLKVQVKPVGFAQDIIQDCVYRQDFPQTHTFLVIDFDDALHYVRRSEMAEWEMTDAYLFDVALDNVAREKPDLAGHALADELPLYTLFHNDFAVACAIELSRNADEAVGPYGAVVNIPAKGSVFIHPLEADTVLDYIAASHEMVQGFYTDEVYTVNAEYYWYYQGRYSLFPMRVEGNQAYLSYPDRLRQLLQNG